MPLQAEGEFALVMEKLDGALSLNGQPVKRGTMAHEHIIYMMLAEAAARIPDQEALAKYAAKLEQLAKRDDHQPYQAIALRSLGINHRLAGEYQEAAQRLQGALELFVELDSQWQVARTTVELAHLSRDMGHRENTSDYLTQALVIFEKLGAQPDVIRTQQALAELA